MAHITRKELKKDEFRETLVHGAEAALTHKRALWIIGIIAVVVIGAVVGWRFYGERQAVKASVALEAAMDVFNARIRAIGEPEQPGEITYVEEKNKYEDAAKKFIEIAQQYGRTRPGQIARYYVGLSYVRLARYDEAEKWLHETERTGNEELVSLARFQLAMADFQTGKNEDAVKLLEDLLARPSVMVPKPAVLLALAEHYTRSNAAEARRLYEQVRTEYPQTSAAGEAEQRLQMLGGT